MRKWWVGRRHDGIRHHIALRSSAMQLIPRYRVFNNHIFYRNLKSTLHSSLAFKVADFLFAAQFTRPRNAPSSALTG
jgi:hypothetical protein